MEGMELICFELISKVGEAKSSFIEAIRMAKAGRFDRAEELIKQGEAHYADGHRVHVGLIQKDAQGGTDLSILLIHAEDQMMSAETFKILSREFLDLYKKIGA